MSSCQTPRHSNICAKSGKFNGSVESDERQPAATRLRMLLSMQHEKLPSLGRRANMHLDGSPLSAPCRHGYVGAQKRVSILDMWKTHSGDVEGKGEGQGRRGTGMGNRRRGGGWRGRGGRRGAEVAVEERRWLWRRRRRKRLQS